MKGFSAEVFAPVKSGRLTKPFDGSMVKSAWPGEKNLPPFLESVRSAMVQRPNQIRPSGSQSAQASEIVLIECGAHVLTPLHGVAARIARKQQ